MGEGISGWLGNLFGNQNSNDLVPATPGMSGISLTGNSPNSFNTPGLSNGISGLQLGQLGLGAGNGLLNAYMGFQNMNLAKQQAKQAQDNWNKQWNANVKSTNTALADRQRARVASNSGAYESVDSYMKKYGIS